jgi:hypothetical protein
LIQILHDFCVLFYRRFRVRREVEKAVRSESDRCCREIWNLVYSFSGETQDCRGYRYMSSRNRRIMVTSLCS